MDKADIAIAIAVLSACFTGWQAYNTQVSNRLQRKAISRKEPVIEIQEGSSATELPEGWSWWGIGITNIEDVAILISRIGVKPRGAAIAHAPDIEMKASLTGQRQTPMPAATARSFDLSIRVAAKGSTVEIFGRPTKRDSLWLTVAARGVKSARDFDVTWTWADQAD